MQLTKHQVKKKKKGLCVASRCCRRRYDRFNFCHKHHKDRYKEKNPERYVYTTLKSNAKRRGKEFDLTFEQFKGF